MSIASGYKKFNRFMKQADGTYIKMSQWTSSNTVHFDDGSTVQANLGAIKGITSDLACEDANVAASMPAVSAKLTELNNGLYDANKKIGTKISYINLESKGEWTMTSNGVQIKYITGSDGSVGIGIYIDGTLYVVLPLNVRLIK